MRNTGVLSWGVWVFWGFSCFRCLFWSFLYLFSGSAHIQIFAVLILQLHVLVYITNLVICFFLYNPFFYPSTKLQLKLYTHVLEYNTILAIAKLNKTSMSTNFFMPNKSLTSLKLVCKNTDATGTQNYCCTQLPR